PLSTSYPRCALPSSSYSSNGHSHLRHLHSFPTRRSSDLYVLVPDAGLVVMIPAIVKTFGFPVFGPITTVLLAPESALIVKLLMRSEEHTSELQSRSDLVCRLLLEKKKTKDYNVLYCSIKS